MPSGTPSWGDTRKISYYRRAGCHTDMAVSIIRSPPLAPLPPAGPVMPEAVAVAGAENRALGILLDDPGAGRPVHVEHIPARAGQGGAWASGGTPPGARGLRGP